MYSLILLDEVVREVDRLAHREGLSRSGLINRILAEHIGLSTPEKQLDRLYGAARKKMEETPSLRVQNAENTPGSSLLSIKSALPYRYNPTIRYNVELTLRDGSYVGELRVVSRSQSGELLKLLRLFFRAWKQLEQSLSHSPPTAIAGGKMTRELRIRGEDTDRTGEALAAYIQMFDTALDTFFAAPEAQNWNKQIELYNEYLNSADILI